MDEDMGRTHDWTDGRSEGRAAGVGGMGWDDACWGTCNLRPFPWLTITGCAGQTPSPLSIQTGRQERLSLLHLRGAAHNLRRRDHRPRRLTPVKFSL